uniref:Uncharacterized protein n=1 Tax=Rhizophagus irregularis (strain DAOM 181602 / DAOM 197198 / MUCL 43194) TaxID=747089 RepID=U9T7I3_RHIID
MEITEFFIAARNWCLVIVGEWYYLGCARPVFDMQLENKVVTSGPSPQEFTIKIKSWAHKTRNSALGVFWLFLRPDVLSGHVVSSFVRELATRVSRYREEIYPDHLTDKNIRIFVLNFLILRTRATEYKQQNIKNSKGPRWEVVNEGEGSFGSSVDQL